MAFLPDGYSTLIGFGADNAGALRLLEKEVSPGGVEIGSIDTTTMRNMKVRTKFPKTLKTIEDIVIQAAYDPLQLTALFANALGVNNFARAMTVQFPDGTRWVYPFVWMDSFKPAALKEGEFPMAEVKFIFAGCSVVVDQQGLTGVPTINGQAWF